MKTFKKALYLGCITDIVFGIYMFLFCPTTYVTQGTYIFLLQGVVGNFSHKYGIYPFVVHLFFMYTTISNAAVQFLYRYLMVCRNIYLTRLKFILITLAFMTFSVSYSLLTVIIYNNQPEGITYFDKLNGTQWPSDGSFTQFGAASTDAFKLQVYLIAIPLTTGSYTIVSLAAYLVWRKLHELKNNMSKETRRMHSEISVILIVEAAVPYITIVIPITIDLVKMLEFDIELGYIAEFCNILVIFAPALNAFVKLCTIKSYRRTIKRIALKLIGKKPSEVTSVANSSHMTMSVRPSGVKF
uniref:7TM_GPCR_Srx domain-containing protein n=1 Tax=Panagrellus redivivus TaxID=6233 RepID=A0A7E4UYP4_PANRE